MNLIEFAKNLPKLKLIASAVFVIVLISTVVLVRDTTPDAEDYEELAKCLTSKGVKLYGSATCPYTNRQLQTFGNSSQYLDYVQCEDNVNECIDAGIKEYPIWVINQVQYPGEQPFGVLSKLSECNL